MAEIKTVQAVPVPEPSAHIDTSANTDRIREYADPMESLAKLREWAEMGGDISDQLEAGIVTRMGNDAVRDWELDNGSRQNWLNNANNALAIACQENEDDPQSKDFPFESASDIHYPLLTVASQQFAARAYPELVKGDKVLGVKVFTPPAQQPSPIETAKLSPQPQDPMQAQQATAEIQADEQQQNTQKLFLMARNARAERVKHYMNFLIFYRMDNWEGETDQLLHEIPITGSGFKKVYYGETGLQSDYVSALRLTVHNDTKSIWKCPRITQDYEIYPYEIEDKKRAGMFRDVELPNTSQDTEAPRKFIEQHRLDDLDEDGLAEPYIVTVDTETRQTMRIEPAYTTDDIMVDESTGTVLRIDRWLPFPSFAFLPDPKGGFYCIGFGKLLASIMDSVDTSINQLIDAGTAQIAGGGFIGAGVRLQGSGQGGSVFFRPGEYQTVSTNGVDLRQAIWERTVPQPSQVTMTMLEMLLAAAKDIASVKDVITGDAPSTAPVGTTLALQNQALQVFSSIYKRIYRGFRDEFVLMYKCQKRWATAKDKHEYQELTGGDFDEDFQGDGTDIQPVADPTVVTKMQKVARIQTLLQLAESAIGQAAGMTQSGPAQEIVRDALDTMDYDRPERFLAEVPPNPLDVAKAQDLAATASLKAAEANNLPAKANKDRADAVHQLALAGKEGHGLHQLADQIAQTGNVQPPAEGDNGQTGQAA